MDLTPIYWLIASYMADDFMQENVTEKMVMISLQVRLYETLCKSNMMSDNFEL